MNNQIVFAAVATPAQLEGLAVADRDSFAFREAGTGYSLVAIETRAR